MICGTQRGGLGLAALLAGFRPLGWACGAPAWCRAQHPGFFVWIPAPLPTASPTLLGPLVASPRHPPSLAGSPLRGTSASSYPVFPGAQSARRRRGGPRDPHASPRVQLRPTRKHPKLFYCCIQKSVNVPWAPTCPRPSRARVVCWGPGSADAGVVAARATGGAISSPSRAGAAGQTALQGDDARGKGAARDPAATAGLCRAHRGGCGGPYSE